ncbi:MAG: sodium/proline symporter [Gemmatimonadales bacterium]
MEPAQTALPSADPWAVGTFVLYLAAMAGIGLWAARFSSQGIGQFFVGGRQMHRIVVALSAVVSGRSAWLLLGVTGLAWTRGASAIWAVAGYTIVEAALFLWYAPRLRRLAGAYDCVTVPDVFEARLGGGKPLRLVLVVVILVFMIGYLAAQFVGGGKAFAAGFGLSETNGILLTAGIVLGYTALGGFLAVSFTDVVQAFIMLAALIVVPVVAGSHAGWDVVFRTLGQLDPTLLDPIAITAGAFLGLAGIGLGSPGSPHILVRYMAIADPRQLKTAAVVGTTWNVLMGVGAVMIGLVGRALLPTRDLLPGADTEALFPTLAQMHLPPIAFGVVVAAIFAAIMSTADSQLLVAASAVVRDFWQKVLGRGTDERGLVRLSRWTVAALVVIALVFGSMADRVVFWLVLFAWAGLGAALGPPSILMLFWKRTTAAGAIAGMVTGAVTVVVWYFVPPLKAAVYELIPAFLLSGVVTVMVSLRTRAPDDLDARWSALSQETVALDATSE